MGLLTSRSHTETYQQWKDRMDAEQVERLARYKANEIIRRQMERDAYLARKAARA